jgi:hypothetical protein
MNLSGILFGVGFLVIVVFACDVAIGYLYSRNIDALGGNGWIHVLAVLVIILSSLALLYAMAV